MRSRCPGRPGPAMIDWRALLALVFCCLRGPVHAEAATPAERQVFVLSDETEEIGDIPGME